MGVYIPNISKPKGCVEEWDFGLMGNPCKFLETDMSCMLQPESEPFDCGKNYETCPLIEIVTCGECKWWSRDGKRKDGKGWCENVICGITKPNAFCSYGERRADEDI